MTSAFRADLLRLTLTPGLGPILISRLVAQFGSPAEVLQRSAKDIERVKGIGPGRSASIVAGMKQSADLVGQELALAERLGVRVLALGEPDYPPLLASIPDAPPILYVRGSLDPRADQYPVAIVGSRDATAYGIEQAERFAGVLARSGLTIVSGGARGIDTAAHRGALRAAGRTIVVMGCGLAGCYPPENALLFDQITRQGAIVTELPLNTAPNPDNFPGRNRLISGLSLGVIVIEAGKRSGALLTAEAAIEEHGREVMAVPGRVDSPASAGTHDLLKSGGAAIVTEPGDVLHILETPARHQAAGTHAIRYSDPQRTEFEPNDPPTPEPTPPEQGGCLVAAETKPHPRIGLSPAQTAILDALDSPKSRDELVAVTGLSAQQLSAELTLLELQCRVRRVGSRLVRGH